MPTTGLTQFTLGRLACKHPMRQAKAMSKDSANDHRILVVGPSWVGDAVMSQCLLKALKARDSAAAIDVLVPSFLTPLFDRLPEVSSVLTSPFRRREFNLPGRIGLGRSLAGRYGTAYILPGSWKSAVVPFAARVPRRCGFLGEARWALLNDIRPLAQSVKRRTAVLYQALAEPEVVSEPSRLRTPSMKVDIENRDRLARSFGLSVGGFAAFAPGAEFGPAKRWPPRHWIALAERLGRLGIRTALFGTSNEVAVGREIAEGRTSVVDLIGRTRLEDAIDLISAARFAVTNDSGLMHVAAAVGCKIVAVYGSTSSDDTPALSKTARFASLSLACSPCRERTCPLGHSDCLEKLEDLAVLNALTTLDSGLRQATSK
jgi:heptosyltransferase-2